MKAEENRKALEVAFTESLSCRGAPRRTRTVDPRLRRRGGADDGEGVPRPYAAGGVARVAIFQGAANLEGPQATHAGRKPEGLPKTISPDEAMAVLGVRRTDLRMLVQRGFLSPVRIKRGGQRFVRRAVDNTAAALRMGTIVLPPRSAQGHVRADHVYVMDGGAFCKVGVTTDTEERLQALQSACPLKLCLVKAWLVGADRALEVEAATLLHFKKNHERGEWLRVTRDVPVRDVVAFIDEAVARAGR